MKATTQALGQYIHPILVDYEMFRGPRGPIFLAFVDESTNERVYATRRELELLKQYIDVMLSFRDEEDTPEIVATSDESQQGG